MNIGEFNWKELFSNDSGKTSMSALCGGLSIIAACVALIIGCITKDNNILTSACWFLGGGSGLLGIRKFMNSKETIPDITEASIIDKKDDISQ